MTEVRVTGTVGASVAEVWAVVGQFGKIDAWLPPIASSRLDPGVTGREVGDTRHVTLDDGPTLVEIQTARSEAGHSYTYTIPESPLPMRGYESTISLRADGDRTAIEWRSTFDPDPGHEDELIDMAKGIYEAGVEDLKRRFGG